METTVMGYAGTTVRLTKGRDRVHHCHHHDIRCLGGGGGSGGGGSGGCGGSGDGGVLTPSLRHLL